MINKVRRIGMFRGLIQELHLQEKNLPRLVWQRLHNPSGVSTPVFLVGIGRSGTSMIVRHLARSWQVNFYNEDHPAAFENWYLRDLSVIEELVRSSHALITLFKPLKDTYRTPLLLSRFQTAKAIFAFRNYNDVINSHRRKFYDKNGLVINPKNTFQKDRRPSVVKWLDTDFAQFSDYPPPESVMRRIRLRWKPSLNLESIIALDWIFYNELYFDLNLHQNDRVRPVVYESLVRNPINEFSSICNFLGLKFEPQIAEGIFSSSISRDPPPEIDPAIRSDCEEIWQRLCMHADTSQRLGAILPVQS